MRRSLPVVLLLACAGLVAVASACKKPDPAVVDSGAPVAVATDAAPAMLAPIDDTDAGEDSGPDAAPVHHAGGPGLTANQSRAKQCCNALRAQAKSLGASPEANVLIGLATSCDSMAMQMGPSGTAAPEFGPLRMMLKGRTMPAMCQGL